ncbi:MAG: beta-ketoacyl-ACP synthase III [Bacteroidota bacterium]
MSLLKAAITGVAGYVPDYVLTNQELETMVDTNDEWIVTRTGIKERRILKGSGKGTSVMGIEAVKLLLEKTNTDPSEIDLVICATCTPDMKIVDTANLIAKETGCSNSFTYDINAACSGFLFALTTGSKFIESGTHKKVVIVGADKMSSIIDYQDRATCIIFGDGAGAVLLEPSEEGFGVQDAFLKSDAAGADNLFIKAGGSAHPVTVDHIMAREQFVVQYGRPVFKAAVSNMSDAVKKVISRNNLTVEDVNWLVPHQANRRIIETVAKMADYPMERVMMNIHKYGNTTAGTIPLCLFDYEDQLTKGDNLILTAFGGGYTWGAVYLTWAI